ncbi:MFS transporter [Saccharothrix violaceirubra]|uniref:EmrB/QacA subfamily drug resistance transporter n=1 Tax=Saccharothrix violaceirubra TaxID=413306 RepID=A0A7W7T6S2_9PSEU|nr:MFS transporter [Saccharothrix violaceirubra]MBB4966240.1 EmrB/QacA subfamily drug resistance transporter [Saccharothrix violaceirubra]
MSTETPAARTASPWGPALAAIVGAEFLLQLDGTVVNVALPALRADLGVDVAAATWVLNAFFLAFGGLLLPAGRLGDVLGHRRVFLLGIGLLTVASLAAGLAPTFEVLIVGRVAQGAGAAIAGPTGLALLAILFTGERQARAFGLYSTVTALGAASGMILGGLLTAVGDWRWSLLVNVPVGVLILAIAVRAVGKDDAARARSLGVPSAVLVTAALGTGVFGLVNAAERGWGQVWTVVPLVVSAVLVAVLVAVDGRAAEPLLPRRVFADRARIGGFVALVLLASVLTGFLFHTSQFLTGTLGFSPLRTGLALLPFGLALLASTQVLTRYVAKWGLRTRATVGLVLVVAAFAWLAAATGSYATAVLPQIVVLGVGVGVAIIPFNMIVLSTVDPADTGIAAGLLQTALTVGGSIGLAVLLLPAGPSAVFAWSAVIAALAVPVINILRTPVG